MLHLFRVEGHVYSLGLGEKIEKGLKQSTRIRSNQLLE